MIILLCKTANKDYEITGYDVAKHFMAIKEIKHKICN